MAMPIWVLEWVAFSINTISANQIAFCAVWDIAWADQSSMKGRFFQIELSGSFSWLKSCSLKPVSEPGSAAVPAALVPWR